MATQGSTIFTVGTLLNRAQDQGIGVRVLVQGVWIEGLPVASDSHGVILDSPDGQYLVKTDAVTVVVYLPEADDEPPPADFAAGTSARQEERRARPGHAPAARPAVEAGPTRS